MSKQNIKIKRSKGRLYKKRRSAGKKVVEIILMVLVVAVLGVVGYSAAGPLINYLQHEGGEPSTTPWEPPESSTPEESETSTTTESEPATTTAGVPDGSGAYLLPVSALSGQSALTSALTDAKSAGCSVIIVPVKDELGHLLYNSSISAVRGSNLVTGTMPAGQISSVIRNQGFTSVKALLPTLYDRTTPQYVSDTGYRFADDSYAWLDANAANGGKQWVDPFRSGTKSYYTQVVRELTGAGFDEVLLSELRFPEFNPYDETILASQFFSSTRYTALTALYTSVNSASSNKTAVAVDIADVLAGYGKSFGGSAEILSDKSFTGTVYLTVNLSDFGTSLATGDNSKINLPADPVQKAKTLVNRAAGYIGTNVVVVPVIEPNGISADALANCYESLRAS